MTRMKLLQVLIVLIGVSKAFSAVTKETCPKIPGWLLFTRGEPLGSDVQENINEEEAERNGNDLRLGTCCDYKSKCNYTVVHKYKDDPANEHCAVEFGCMGVDTGRLKIRRKGSDNQWTASQYCHNHFSGSSGIDNQYCKEAAKCFQNSKNKNGLLKCIEALQGQRYDPGFFSDVVWPYRIFSYTELNSKNQIQYTLTAGGEILKSTAAI